SLDSTYSPSLAYGTPDPAGPCSADTTNFFTYAGTSGGKIFVTFNGGGSNGNNRLDLSAGLDGSGVQMIVTNPLRGSHEAYAVTSRGVYHIADSTTANPTWVNITSNVFQITHNPFGDPTLAATQAKDLTSIQADWRYVVPDSLSAP